MRKVVVTGLGSVSPLGLTVHETWDSCLESRSGVGPITLFDSSDYLVQIACEVKNFNPKLYMSAAQARRRDRCQQLATAAAQEALAHSGLEITERNSEKIGTIVSSAIGGLTTLEQGTKTIMASGPRRVSPFTIPMLMPNGASGLIAIDSDARGPALSVSSACASGSDGIGLAWQLIRAGVLDVAIAGGTEATICGIAVGAFDRLGAMSRRNEDYSMTPQPFDRDRDGLVMGEGAAVLILEESNTAKERGAQILAELSGYAATADSFHITAPQEDGSGGAAAIKYALETAGINSAEVDYINAHGTATPLNDLSETRALKTAFGEMAGQIPISSTKSMTGHMMGATGAMEAIFCVKAITDAVAPPTIHYSTPDPECNLDYIPNTAREIPIDIAISNSFGFGGHNSVLVFNKFK